MITLVNHHRTAPGFNLAAEEYCLKHAFAGDDILLFYVNAPSVIIGKHQNAFEEVDMSYAEAHGISVHRRLSGGGAVYHDTGNLNYSLICRRRSGRFPQAATLLAPIVEALKTLGVPASTREKHDIYAGNAKISGFARYCDTRSMLCHGTLLVHSDLTALSHVLDSKDPEISSGSVKSIRSPVANISELTERKTDVGRVRRTLLEQIQKHRGRVGTAEWSRTDHVRIRTLAEEKYDCWDWNFGRAPRFAVQREYVVDQQRVPVTITVESGRIARIDATESVHRVVNESVRHLMGRAYSGSETEQLLAAAIERR